MLQWLRRLTSDVEPSTPQSSSGNDNNNNNSNNGSNCTHTTTLSYDDISEHDVMIDEEYDEEVANVMQAARNNINIVGGTNTSASSSSRLLHYRVGNGDSYNNSNNNNSNSTQQHNNNNNNNSNTALIPDDDSQEEQEVNITDARGSNFQIIDFYDPRYLQQLQTDQQQQQQQSHIIPLNRRSSNALLNNLKTRPRSSSNSSLNSGSSSTTTLPFSNLIDCNLTRNPFTEVNILNTEPLHTNIIRRMVPLFDESDTFYNLSVPSNSTNQHGNCLMASSGDDGIIVIWDVIACKKLFTCVGHRLPVTCMTLFKIRNHSAVTQLDSQQPFTKYSSLQKKNVLSNYILLTGSCDKSIKMWNLVDGTCIRTISEHRSSVKCICVLDHNRFCSAGNDSQIHVWSSEGELLGSIERADDDNIHQLLAVSPDRIVVASDNNASLLYVYDTEKFRRIPIGLRGHQESVQCLIKVNERMFASASIDGAIILWDSSEFTCIRKLSEPITSSQYPFTSSDTSNYQQTADKRLTQEATMVATSRRMPHVRHLSVINTRYLSAAIGKNILVYDVETGQSAFKVEKAHEADIVKIIALHNGNVLITCSEDSKIKVWNTFGQFPVALSLYNKQQMSKEPSSSIKSNSPRSSSKRRHGNKESVVHPALLGELALHAEAIHDLVPLSPYSFASCGADKLIMVWKDDRIEKRIRSFYAYKHQSIPNIASHHPNSNTTQPPLPSSSTQGKRFAPPLSSPIQVSTPLFSSPLSKLQ